MKKHTHVRILAATVLLLSLLVPVFASAIPVTYTTVDPGLTIKISHANSGSTGTTTVTAWTGVYNLQVGDGSGNTTPYQSFCIDVFQNAPTSTINDYKFGNLTDVFSDQAATDINKLWSSYFDAGWDDSNESKIEAAALQLAIWEITTEDILSGKDSSSYDYDLSKGGFVANYVNHTIDDNAVNTASGWLNNLAGTSLGATSSLVALTSGTGQDYVVAAPVPEPATLLLFGTGLVGTAFIRRRKKGANS